MIKRKIYFGWKADEAGAFTCLSDPADAEALKVCGPKGLLQFFNMQLGLPLMLPAARKVLLWKKAFQASGAGGPYVKSFERDPVGTSGLLLQSWELMKWYGPAELEDGRKELLEKIARHLPKGFLSERACFDQTQAALAERGLPYTLEIQLMESLKMLPAIWQSFFKELPENIKVLEPKPLVATAAAGTNLAKFQEMALAYFHRTALPLTTFLPEDDSLSLVEGSKGANMQAAALALQEQQIHLIADQGAETGLSELLFQTCSLSCDTQSLSTDTQFYPLIKAALCFAWGPLDVIEVFDFLSLTYSPFSKTYGHYLKEALRQLPGIGNEEWQKAIEKAREKAEGNESISWESWEREYHFWFASAGEEEEIPSEYLIDRLQHLESWAERRQHIPGLAPASRVLLGLIAELKLWIKEFEEAYTPDSLMQLLNSWKKSLRCKVQEQLVGAPPVYEPGAALQGEIPVAYWWQICKSNNQQRCIWRNSDISQWQGACTAETESSLWLYQQVKALCSVRDQLTFFSSPDTEMHPLMLLLDQGKNNSLIRFKAEAFIETADAGEVIKFPDYDEQKAISGLENLRVKEKLSYTSLYQLICLPHLYIFNYGLNMQEKKHELALDAAIAGKAYHKLLELLIDEERVSFEDIIQLTKKEVSLLASPKYGFELNRFCSHIQYSLKSLQQLMKQNSLEVQSREEGFVLEDYPKKGFTLTGVKDLVLANEQIVLVMDYKSGGSKKLKKLLKEEIDLQLMLYRKSLKMEEEVLPLYFLPKTQKYLSVNHKLNTEGLRYEVPTDRLVSSYEKQEACFVNAFVARKQEFEAGNVPLFIRDEGKDAVPHFYAEDKLPYPYDPYLFLFDPNA